VVASKVTGDKLRLGEANIKSVYEGMFSSETFAINPKHGCKIPFFHISFIKNEKHPDEPIR